uniref:Ig-like domain-containing protein n=1 Tax=Knipowitschia caucasica TaxID=637954 RepID=A0AAV2LX61_KNICA
MPDHMSIGNRFLLFLCLVGCCDGTCPNMCLCVSDAVICSSTGLTKLPTSLPSFSITLDLSHNYLSYLGAGSFEKMPRLENLRLADNQLVNLGDGVFQNATSLRFLDLSSNKLHVVEQHYFRGNINNSLITIFPNGTLEIQSVKVNDTGLYVCTALDAKLGVNATREVNVSVLLPPPESFNTGYTTLLGCAVTMVLILVYLYLTPCRCSCCKQPKPPSTGAYDPSSLSSVFTSSMREGKGYSDKHVAFLEPMMSSGVAEDWTQEA